MVSRRCHGFTLVELAVTLAILAVLSALAMPSMARFIAIQRLKSAGSDLHTALTRARSEAIKRNTDITLAPATAGRWQDGWQIANLAGSSTRIDAHGAVAGTAIDGPASVVYLANGRIKGSSAPAFDLSATGTDQRRCVSADLSGRPYQRSSACATP